MKFCAFLYYHSRTKSIIKFVHEVYNSNGKRDDHSNYEILAKSTRTLLTLEICFICFVLIPVSFAASVVFFNWWWYDRNLLTIFIPFVDENTDIGSLVHLVYHLLCILMCGVGTVGSDLQLCILSFHLWTLTKILRKSASDFNRLVSLQQTKYACKHSWLLNLAKMHIDYYQ